MTSRRFGNVTVVNGTIRHNPLSQQLWAALPPLERLCITVDCGMKNEAVKIPQLGVLLTCV